MMINNQAIEDRFICEQQKIYDLAEVLKNTLSGPPPDDVKALTNSRWNFASSLMRHLAAKERYIYSKLEHHDRLEVKDYFKKSKDDLLDIFGRYVSHTEFWNTSKAISNWSAYLPSAHRVVDAFTERLKREERDLFPFVRSHSIDISAPSAVTSNWVRKAFDIKASFEG